MTQPRDAAQVQDALYRIAELAGAAHDMQEFYGAVHGIVGELMYAENLLIVLYDEERQLVNWPYYADVMDFEVPDPHKWDAMGAGDARGATAWMLRTGKPQLMDYQRFTELVEQKEVELRGVITPETSWMGVPLQAEGRAVGALVVQSYTAKHQYTEDDLDLLAFVGQHIGAALSRARAIEETRQRNAELALINSVQTALAGELELQAIYDLVGDKIQEIFDAQVVDISVFDLAARTTDFPYVIERGVRLAIPTVPLAEAYVSMHLVETKATYLDNEVPADTPVLRGEPALSILAVPLFSGDEVTGRISLQNLDRTHAFTDSDVRLLETLAGSLSVALDNARLVHETRQRNAELALINSVQSALAGELELQAIYDVVGEKVREVFDAQVTDIALLDESGENLNFAYGVELGVRQYVGSIPVMGFRKHVLETLEPVMINERTAEEAERYGNPVIVGEMPKSVLFVPLISAGKAIGVISLQNITREHAFSNSDVRLLSTLAGSLSVALENARLIHETRQRNAELALINSVQAALAGELELQAIYDLVGDKIQEIFDAQVVDIGLFDFAAGLIRYPYAIERGVRFPDEPVPIASSQTASMLFEQKSAVLINDMPAWEREHGQAQNVNQGEPSLAILAVPLFSGDEVSGRISLQNLDRTNAFTESDVRLLSTLASSLSVALENARLVHVTRQRNAELALINSVQAAIAGELDQQAIYDIVGDKIQEVFDAQVVDIGIWDEAAGLIRFPYVFERGVRSPDEPMELVGFRKHVIEAREPLLIDANVTEARARYGNPLLVGQHVTDDEPKSILFVPLVAGEKVTGVISLQNFDRERAFAQSDVQLLETLSRSLSVALENARLVHETKQRNAELALINSVQQAIAGELDQQSIYDIVGDKIQEVFDAQAVLITLEDPATGLHVSPYAIERGERLEFAPGPPGGFTQHVIETGKPVMVLEDVNAARERLGLESLVAGEAPKSILFVPLFAGTRAIGAVSLQNVDREHAFTEADQRLLATLAGSLSVALENARLIHETRQRNAELALINSVQDALAGELELQAIYDVVGDKIQEIFDAQVVDIGVLDETDGLIHFPYVLERGERFEGVPATVTGFRKKLLEEQRPLLIEAMTPDVLAEHGFQVATGDMAKSALWVPLVVGGKGRGWISLQNVDREYAFGKSDVQLLSTLAASLGVALENARLVHETRQRVAELALINSVQDALAGELNLQAIYDVVGDKIQEVFDAQVVDIAIYDEADGMVHYPYSLELGNRLPDTPTAPVGFRKTLLERHEPLLINENMISEAPRLGMEVIGEAPKSGLWMPLVVSGKGRGWISLQNIDREHAFSESHIQLLGTIAASLGVALENARLVHETRQRVAELATINSVQDSIAGELDLQTIYDVVGEKLREVFDAQVVDIAVHDEEEGVMRFVYQIERGVHFDNISFPVMGFRKHVLETREPLAILENMTEACRRYGNPTAVVGEESHGSAIFQPLVVGGRATGVMSIHNLDQEHAFSASDQQLLATIAGSLGVALENAKLIHETRQRVAELGTVNSVGQALVAQVDLDALIQLVGDRVRETFDADITYVALHDEATGLIEFPYNWELGKPLADPPLRYGEGLTSQIIESGEPLLLDRDEGDPVAVGTPSKSFLGVPIWAGDRAIGVISVQSTREEGRYGEDDVRLLSTIAANVGVAIQNARLFTEIQRQKQYFESLVGISPVAVIEMDADERLTGWNPAATALFGYTADEVLGEKIDDLVLHEEHREEGREITWEAVTAGRAHRITRRRRKDGSPVDVELLMVPLEIAGEKVGFLGIYHDITELQQAREEAEAATQAKSAFLATMSHEIRTPMNAVIGMTGLLLGTELTPEQREFAEVVRSSGDALLHVIDDILDYSKIEAGKLELEREPFDLRECVDGALDMIAPRAAEKSLELGCLTGEHVPAGIVGDAARLRQVLLNLLSNAVKFTEAGEVVVDLDAEPAGAGSSRIRLAVRDTGIGIPPHRMGRLFESFSQVDASTTRKYGGTGLGLAISKRLVELMGGTLRVESEEGRGSTFHIELVAREAEVPQRTPFVGTQPDLEGKRLLVVDDNATNREIVSRQASSWGMEPVPVESPLRALELIQAGEAFDVAVLDMVMPEMDGRELARAIRRYRAERELPLVLVTSLGRLPQARTADEFSAQLAKPLKASQLFDALMRVLAAQAEAPAPAPAEGERAEASSLRILLAEDSAVNQKVALALLGKMGYQADVVWNGLEALTALEQQPYDVVLMDVQMPELDGLDTTRRIRERWPGGGPRIIAMTANALQEDRDACFAAGMDDYVAKPIRPEALAAALGKVQPLVTG